VYLIILRILENKNYVAFDTVDIYFGELAQSHRLILVKTLHSMVSLDVIFAYNSVKYEANILILSLLLPGMIRA